jgi:integrase
MMMPQGAVRAHLPIEEFNAELLGHYAYLGCRATTVCKVRQALNLLVELAGVRTTADLNDEAVRRFIERQPAGQSRETLHSKLSALRAACNHAVDAGLLPAAPAFPAIPQPGRRTEEVPPFALDDIMRLLAYLRTLSTDWEGFRLFALTGTILFARLAKLEALRLRIKDCDLHQGTVRILTRALVKRSTFPPTVHICPPLRSILTGWLPLTGPDWMFPTKTRSGPWTGGRPGIKPLDQLRTAGREVGIDGLTFESLRRFSCLQAAPDLGLGADLRPALPSSFAETPRRDESIVSLGANIVNLCSVTSKISLPIQAVTIPPIIVARVAPIRRGRPRLTLDGVTQLMIQLLRESASWEGHRLFALVGVALFTGERRGTLLGLECYQCDPTACRFYIPSRSTPTVISPTAAKIIADWLPRIRGSRWVFPGTKLVGPWVGGRPGGKPLDQLNGAAQKAGVGHVTFEALRALWKRHAGRILLGEEYTALQPPERTPDGPRPRRPGPSPSRSRAAGQRLPWGPDSRSVSENPPPDLVTLTDREVPPIVLGRKKKRLTRPGYRVVKALLEAGPDGLSKPQLLRICGDALGVLRRLSKSDSDWKAVIHFPGKDGIRHYRIGPSASTRSNPRL